MLRFCGPFLFLALVPALYYAAGPAAPLLSILLLLVALTGAEWLTGRGDAAGFAENPRGYRLLVLFYIPAQIAVTAWAVWVSQRVGATGFVALVLSVGVTGGVFGMLAAHEAVHSGDRFEAWLGSAMLTAMSYRHFRIAHIHGHHRWAGTEQDSATARLGESFYHFLPRTVAGQFREAWQFEQQRKFNRVAGDVAIMGALFAIIGLGVGPRALLFFILQSVVAVTVLELFNYIAHYGLARGRDADGRLQRFEDRHSWNSSNRLANALIFNMGRHSSHHRRPAAPYQELRMHLAPELPLGYAGSILLALVPPSWRRLMDEKARAWTHTA
jgi:alkane 1-monooxygenase